MKSVSTEIFLTDLFKLLNGEGIDYCVLRNYETLPKEIRGTDIDLLVSPAHKVRFWELTKKAAEQNAFQLLQVYEKSFHINHYKFYNQLSGEVIRLDVMDKVGALCFEFFSAHEILNEKQFNGALFTPKLEHEVSTVLLQNWFSLRGKLKTKYYESIRLLSNVEKQNFYEILDNKVGTTYSKLLPDKLLSDLDGINSFLKKSRGKVMLSYYLRNPFETFVNSIYLLKITIKRLLFPPGLFVVLAGPDGSGKSTIINKVAALLDKVYPSISIEHLHPKLLPRLQDIKKKIISQKVEGFKNSEWEMRNQKKSFLKSLITVTYYTLNYILGYFLIIFPKLVKGELVLYDRYCYDFLIDPKSKGIMLPEFIVKIFLFFIPKPNKGIFLYVDPSKLINRKNEIPIEEVEVQIKRFRALVHNDSRFFEVDNSGEIETTVLWVSKKIIEAR